jgi:Flp pilus assembly protein TadD
MGKPGPRLARTLTLVRLCLFFTAEAGAGGDGPSLERCKRGRFMLPDEHVVACRRAADDHPTDVDVALAFGRSLLRAGRRDASRYGEAWAVLSRVIELDPDRSDGFALGARAAVALGREELAEQYIARALKLDPENANAFGAAAILELRRGKLDDARTNAQKCVTIRSDDPDLQLTLARVLREAGDPSAALEVLRRPVFEPMDTDHYRDPDLLVLRAQVRRDLAAADFAANDDASEPGVAFLRQALRDTQRPEVFADPTAASLRMRLYADLAKRVPVAERRELVQRATTEACRWIGSSPPTALMYDDLGLVLERSGDREAAFAAYRRAAALAPEVPESYEGILRLLDSGGAGERRSPADRSAQALWALWHLATVRPTAALKEQLLAKLESQGMSRNDAARLVEEVAKDVPREGGRGRGGIEIRFPAPVDSKDLVRVFDAMSEPPFRALLEPRVWLQNPCVPGRQVSTRDVEPNVIFGRARDEPLPRAFERLTMEYKRELGLRDRSRATSSTSSGTSSETAEPLQAGSAEEVAAQIARRDDLELLAGPGAFVGPGIRWRFEESPVRLSGKAAATSRNPRPTAALLELCKNYRIGEGDCQFTGNVTSRQNLTGTLRADDEKTREAVIARLRALFAKRKGPRPEFVPTVAAAARAKCMRLKPDGTSPATALVEFVPEPDAPQCDSVKEEDAKVSKEVIGAFGDVKDYVTKYYAETIRYVPSLDGPQWNKAGLLLLDAFEFPPNAPRLGNDGSTIPYVPRHPDLLSVPTDPLTLPACLTGPTSNVNHGEHLFGLISAKPNQYGIIGLARWTDVRPVAGSGPMSTTSFGVQNTDFSDVLGAIGKKLLHEKDRWVVNASFTFKLNALEDMRSVKRTIDRLRDQVLVVATSSDEGANCNQNECTYLPGGAGDQPNVLTVTGVGPDIDPPRLLRVPASRLKSDGGDIIGVAAPGWRVLGPELPNHYSLRNGSSEATAIVSAIASILLRQNLTPFQVKQRLVGTSRLDIVYGNDEVPILGGVLDAKAALTNLCRDVVVTDAVADGCHEVTGRVVRNPAITSFVSLSYYDQIGQERNGPRVPVDSLLRIHAAPAADDGEPRFTVLWRDANAQLESHLNRLREGDQPVEAPTATVNSVQIRRSVLLQSRPEVYDCKLLSTESRSPQFERPCLLFEPAAGTACATAPAAIFLDQVKEVYFRLPDLFCPA